MLSYRLNPVGLTLNPLSCRVSLASTRRIAACFLITLFLAGCETEPITPAPIKEQSLSLPKESEKVKLETTVKTDSTVKPASPSAPDSSSPASSASSKQTIQSKDKAPASSGTPSPESFKQKEEQQDVAVASPLDEAGGTIQSVPQHQRVILDEKTSGGKNAAATSSNVSDLTSPAKPVLPAPILNWAWPTDLPIAQPFSDARKGVDFSGPAGQPVKAVANGIASYLGSSLRGYGQMVVIKHDEGFISVYANNSKILVKEGQKIEKGQKIAETGHADGSDLALHFELRQQGKPLDPKALFPPR